jgi:hypothetical protein
MTTVRFQEDQATYVFLESFSNQRNKALRVIARTKDEHTFFKPEVPRPKLATHLPPGFLTI